MIDLEETISENDYLIKMISYMLYMREISADGSISFKPEAEWIFNELESFIQESV